MMVVGHSNIKTQVQQLHTNNFTLINSCSTEGQLLSWVRDATDVHGGIHVDDISLIPSLSHLSFYLTVMETSEGKTWYRLLHAIMEYYLSWSMVVLHM